MRRFLTTICLSLPLSFALVAAEAEPLGTAPATTPATEAASVPAAPPTPSPAVATWRSGPGTVAGKSATANQAISGETLLVAGNEPVRIDLAKAAAVAVFLAPGSQVRIREIENDAIVEVDRGTIQMDVGNRMPYQRIRALGAALDIAVTGTLFVVERQATGSDFLALIDGSVKVHLRDEIAKTLGQGNTGEVELVGRQAISGSTSGGLGSIEALSSRPQLPSTASAIGVREQTTSGAGTSWDTDLASSLTNPDAAPGSSAEAAAAAAESVSNQVREAVTDQVMSQINAEVTSQVADQVQQQVIQDATQPTGLAGHPPLPGP